MNETISVVIPVFNNQDTLVELTERIRKTVEPERSLELILVDDCSRDDSWRVIGEIARSSPARVIAVQSLRNLGQHPAIVLGLNHAHGAWCAVLDADLQDQPEAITELLAAADDVDVVFAGRRGWNQGFIRQLTGTLYRKLLGMLAGIPPNVGAFSVLRHDAVRQILALPVTKASLMAMVGLAGLRSKSISIQREQRAKGESGYSTWSRIRVARQMLSCIFEFHFQPADRTIGSMMAELSTASLLPEKGDP